ncbi:hypothetical protein L484_025850 [Morus notabilis]|uniref:Uncharacterized protein n=1 Tax=Morus notabilis TaxID=981085 RepID=W9RAR3_9ROSA|nr:hypothetical protein L484_025850 [Morus notabilis]
MNCEVLGDTFGFALSCHLPGMSYLIAFMIYFCSLSRRLNALPAVPISLSAWSPDPTQTLTVTL